MPEGGTLAGLLRRWTGSRSRGDGMGVPAGFPAREDIKLMDFDPATALKDAEANKAKFTELFGAE